MTAVPIAAEDRLWSDLRGLAAAAVDAGPGAGVERLRQAGLLALDPGDGRGLDAAGAVALATTQRRLGRADLVMARLFEGHVNALKLIALHGSARQRADGVAQAAQGVLFGVWGADADPPATREGGRLAGRKRFCSGLGVVGRAVVPVGDRLVLIDASDRTRQDPDGWTASAMRASTSGRFDLTDLAHQTLGPPGVYATEPFFEGGIWRYSAAHVGGAEALIDAMRTALAAQGRDTDPIQAARLAVAVAKTHAARRMVEDAAVTVEGAVATAAVADSGSGAGHAATDAVHRAVALALLTREVVEAVCVEVMTLAERALGTMAHDGAGDIDRMRRDLSLFLRQANLDGKLAAAAHLMRQGGWRAGETW